MKLYIDPGTGSMLFTIIIGLATTGLFLGKGLLLKIKQRLSGGKVKVDKTKIPLVIFSDHKRYWNVFHPICDELENRKIFCEYWTMSSDDPALTIPYKYIKCSFIGEGNKAFAKLNMMKANICLATTPGLDVLQWKRSRDADYYVHIYHSPGDCTAYRMFALNHYDAVLLSGTLQEEPVRELEKLRNLPEKELVLVGSPYLDDLLKKSVRNSSIVEKDDTQKTILCAPSWGESSILNKFGEAFLDALIATGYNIIVRPHPQSFTADPQLMERLQEKYPNNASFQWNKDNDNFKVLSEADIMISDFSGVIFDYCFIFDKPIIYTETNFDTSPYDVAWLDELPWNVRIMDTLGRKLSTKDFPNMKDIIDSVIADDQYAVGRKKARRIAWAYPGESAQKVVDFLENKLDQLSQIKDVNENEEFKS